MESKIRRRASGCLVLFFLFSCTNPPQAHLIAGDVLLLVDDNVTVPIEKIISDVERTISITFLTLENEGVSTINAHEALKHLNIQIVSEPFGCGHLIKKDDALCSGVYYKNQIVIAQLYSTCIAYSSLSHELIHWVLDKNHFPTDRKHENAVLWTQPGGLAYRAKIQACAKECPDICSSKNSLVPSVTLR